MTSQTLEQQDRQRAAADKILRLIRIVVLVCLAIGLVTLAVVPSYNTLVLTAMGLVPLCIVGFTLFLQPPNSLIDPRVIFFALIFQGVNLKIAVLVYLGPTDSLITSRILPGAGFGAVMAGVIVLTLGTAFVLAGFHATKSRDSTSTRYEMNRFALPRLTFIATILVVVTALCFMAFVSITFTSSGGGISGKRFNDIEGGANARVFTFRYLLFRVAQLARVPLYLLLAVRLSNVWVRPSRFLLFVAFAVSFSLPLYANNSAGIILLIIDVGLIWIAYTGRTTLSGIATAGVAAVASFWFVLNTRSGASVDFFQGYLKRDLLDITKIGMVASADLDRLYGESLVGWLVAFVPEWFLPFPRPLFAGFGNYVWWNVYGGVTNNGIAPSLFGELYLNFGYPGVVIGSFLFGSLLRMLYSRYRTGVGSFTPALAIVCITRFCIFGLSNNFGTGVVKLLLELVPLVLVLSLARRPVARTRAGRIVVREQVP